MNGIESNAKTAVGSCCESNDQNASSSSENNNSGGVKIGHRCVKAFPVRLRPVMELLKVNDVVEAEKVFEENVWHFPTEDIAQSLMRAFKNRDHQDFSYQSKLLCCVEKNIYLNNKEKSDKFFKALNIKDKDDYFSFMFFLDKHCKSDSIKKPFSEWLPKRCEIISPEKIMSSVSAGLDKLRMVFDMMHNCQDCDGMIGDVAYCLIEEGGLNHEVVSKIDKLIMCVFRRQLSSVSVKEVRFPMIESSNKESIFDCIVRNLKENYIDRPEFLVSTKNPEVIDRIFELSNLEFYLTELSESDIKKCISELWSVVVKNVADVIFKYYSTEGREKLRLKLLSSEDLAVLEKSNKMIFLLSVDVQEECLKDEMYQLFCERQDVDYWFLLFELAKTMGAPFEKIQLIAEMESSIMNGKWFEAIDFLPLINEVSQKDCLHMLNMIHGYLQLTIDDYDISGNSLCRTEYVSDCESNLYGVMVLIDKLGEYVSITDFDDICNSLENVIKILGCHFYQAFSCFDILEQKMLLISLSRYQNVIEQCESHFEVSFREAVPDDLLSKIKSMLISRCPEFYTHHKWVRYLTFTESELSQLIQKFCTFESNISELNFLLSIDVKLNQEARKHIENSLNRIPFFVHNDPSWADRREEFLSILEHQTIKAFYDQLEQ